MQIIDASFPEQPAALGPTSRQWDPFGFCQPNRLGEALANDDRIHLGKTDSVLQFFSNVKHWWIEKKITWPSLGPISPETPSVLSYPSAPPWVDLSFRGFCMRLLWSKPKSSIPPAGPLPQLTCWCVSIWTNCHYVLSLAQQALHVLPGFLCTKSLLYAPKFLSSSLNGVFDWEYLWGCSSSQLSVLRFLKLLLSQLVLAVGINGDVL